MLNQMINTRIKMPAAHNKAPRGVLRIVLRDGSVGGVGCSWTVIVNGLYPSNGLLKSAIRREANEAVIYM
jgi:hypothetical protein